MWFYFFVFLLTYQGVFQVELEGGILILNTWNWAIQNEACHQKRILKIDVLICCRIQKQYKILPPPS